MQHQATRISSYFVLAIITIFVGCRAGGDYTGIEYMPDMKHSRAFETYSPTSVFADGKTAQLPVEGTIKRGFTPYNYANTNVDYERAGREVKSPFNSYEHKLALNEGKNLYNIYCAVCHGKKGAANGTIVANGKYPPPPSYFRADILELPEGKMFHSVTHGKNLMGGYSSQLNKEERWKVISYIRDMQAKHIAKEEKISEEAALKKIFVGGGYLTEAQEAKLVEGQSTPVVDDEYAGLKSIEQLLEEYQNSEGYSGPYGNDHDAGHGESHGSHSDGHGASHTGDNKNKAHSGDHHHNNKDHKKNHDAEGAHDKDADHTNDLDSDLKNEKKLEIEKIEVEKPDIKQPDIKKEAVKEASVVLAKQYKSLTADTKVSRGDVFELKNIQFSSGKSTMRGSSAEDLNRLTNILNSKPNQRIRIVGHTDKTGDEEKNKKLSKERALEVKNYLVNTSAISEDRIQVRGAGSSKPVATNKTRKGRQTNRRTEVTFL